MRVLLTALSALTLTACNQSAGKADQPDPAIQDEQAAAENNCPATARSTWERLQIDASATGADCATAQATLTISNGATTLWSETYPAEHVMVLAGAASTEDMQRMLNEWVNPAGASLDSTGDLPEWPANADSPMSGEFPFYVEEGVQRAAYEGARRRDAPMFCYVQGMESLACLALENGRLTKIGVQSFPG